VSAVPAVTPERPCILFVDDEERILSALGALFRQRFDVITSIDAQAALDIVRTRRPHVVVSDQRMPRMTGVEFLRQARELDESCVRILLTGYSDLAAIVGSINDGEVFRFVNKPWINQDLRDTVVQAFEIACASREVFPPQPAAAGSPVVETPGAAAVLVATRARDVLDLVGQRNGLAVPVKHAADLPGALGAIEACEVAVLVCDLDTFEGGDVLLKTLKQAHPRIQAVALAGNADASDLIGLINEAQVFRFMTRPLRAGLIERSVNSAMVAYGNFKAKPALVRRQSVQTKAAVAESSIGRMILARFGWPGAGTRPTR